MRKSYWVRVQAYVYFNDNFELEIGFFEDETSTATLNDDDILLNSYRIGIDYNELYTRLYALNEQLEHSGLEPEETDTSFGSIVKLELEAITWN